MQGRLLFVITEDWFFRSHFLPMADAAKASGFEVFIACRCGPARADLEARGLTVLPLEGRRSEVTLASAWREARTIRQAMRTHRIDIVHFIALRPILIGFMLALIGPGHRSVYALTGRGYLGGDRRLFARLLRMALRVATPRVWAGKNAWFLFENKDDPAFLGLDPATSPNISVLGGAGVDPDQWRPAALPPGDTLRVAFIGRMLRIKGVADAVEAVSLARQAGAAVELSLYGEPDPANPASLTEAELMGWGARPGVAWHGRTDNAAAVWAAHHVCVQPSHEGEGLPRALLEAASCGRALVATDTPGCRDFIRDGVDGLLAPPGRPDRLAEAFATLAGDRRQVEQFAAAARRRIFEGYTVSDVQAATARAYRLLWSGGAIS